MDNPIRRYPRVNKLFLIAYVNREENKQRTPVCIGRTLDISPAGIGMEVYEEVNAGSTMEMELDLKDFILSVQGKVMHARRDEEGRYIIGVEFDEPQEKLAGITLE